jgi:hypothetical protein
MRIRGHVTAAAAFVVGMLATHEASAFEFGTPATLRPFRSAQNFALELRFSPYYAAVDDEPGLRGTPFKDRFGDKPRLSIGAEFDWQTLRIPYVGTLGPGLGLQYVTMSRDARTVSGAASGDSYSLDIYPFYLTGVLRADVFWRTLGFPIVPYGKLGLAWAPWRASNTGGTSSSDDGISGKGQTFGTHVALGAMFALDVLDYSATRNMDSAVGINGTYLYAELYWLNLNGLGQSNALYVGTTTWAAGLAFEF